MSTPRLTRMSMSSGSRLLSEGQTDSDGESDLEFRELESRKEAGNPSSKTLLGTSKSFTREEERAVIRKIDHRVMPLVIFLSLITLADITNIGHAKIAGLDLDLDLGYDGFEMIIVGFYLAYMSSQWIGIAWTIVPGHVFLGAIAMTWGIAASLQSVTTSVTQIVYLRIVLGLAAAGVNSLPLYLSFFYKRDELGLRVGYFIAAVPFFTSIGSMLALLIMGVGEKLPLDTWRLLLLLEGLPCVLLAIWGWSRLPDNPISAQFLSKREKQVAQLRLVEVPMRRDGSDEGIGSKLRAAVATLVDPKNYIITIMFFLTNLTFTSMPSFILTNRGTSFAAMPTFLPVMVNELGFSAIESHILCAPPYLASCFMVIFTTYRSDATRRRSYFICVHALVSAFGYAFIAFGGWKGWNAWLLYFAIYPASLGHFSILALLITWTINNQDSRLRQILSFAMVQLVGQWAPGFAVRIYPESDDPFYTKAMTICMVSMLFVAALAACLKLYLARKNALLLEARQAIDEERVQFLDQSDSGFPKAFML